MVQSERSPSENKERAYIAASRRSDRSLEARVQSARMASKIHKERTGKGLKISEEIVSKEEMYEEEDDIPSFYRFAGALPFPPRFQAYATLQSGLHNITAADANHQRVHSAFAQAFPHLNGIPQQNTYAQPAQSLMPLMSGNPASIDTAFTASQPVSPATAMINPTSPAAVNQTSTFSPGNLPHQMASPMTSVHSPMVTPPAMGHTPTDSPSPHGFFGAQVVSSPMSQANGGFPAISPSGLSVHNQRSMSLSSPSERRGSSGERGAVLNTQSFPEGWAPLQAPEGWSPADWEWHGMPLFDDVSSEPPPKRRRSQPTIRDHGHHAHTPSFPSTSFRNATQQHNPTFTSKPPGSLQLLYHKSDDKDLAAMGFSTQQSFQRQPIVLQNPPPPKSRHPSRSQVRNAGDSSARSSPAETSPMIPEEEEVIEHSDCGNSEATGNPQASDAGFSFDAAPLVPELLADQHAGLHDDLELTQMLEQPATFQFDSLTHEASDDQFGGWEDMLNIPASQPENDEES